MITTYLNEYNRIKQQQINAIDRGYNEYAKSLNKRMGYFIKKIDKLNTPEELNRWRN